MPAEIEVLIKNFLDWRARVNLSGTNRHFSSEFRAAPAFSAVSQSLRVFVPEASSKRVALSSNPHLLSDSLANDFKAALDAVLSGFDALPLQKQLLALRAIINIPSDVGRNVPSNLVTQAYLFVYNKHHYFSLKDRQDLVQAMAQNCHVLFGPFLKASGDKCSGLPNKPTPDRARELLAERSTAEYLLDRIWRDATEPERQATLSARALSRLADHLRGCDDHLRLDRSIPLRAVSKLQSDDEKYDTLCLFARDHRNVKDEWFAQAAKLRVDLKLALLVMAINEKKGSIVSEVFTKFREVIQSLPAHQREDIFALLSARFPQKPSCGDLTPYRFRDLRKSDNLQFDDFWFDIALDEDKVALFYDLLVACRKTQPYDYAKLAGAVWRLPAGARSSAFDSIYKHAIKLPEAMQAHVLSMLAQEFTVLPADKAKDDKPGLFSTKPGLFSKIGERVGLISGGHLFATRDSAFRELLAAVPISTEGRAAVLAPLIASFPALPTTSLLANFKAVCDVIEAGADGTPPMAIATLLSSLASQLHLLSNSDLRYGFQALSKAADKVDSTHRQQVYQELTPHLRRLPAELHERDS